MIGQLSSIVKRRNTNKREHAATAEGSCWVIVEEEGAICIDRTRCRIPDDAVRRSLVLDHLSASVGEAVPLPISESSLRCWFMAVQKGRRGLLGYEAEEFAVITTAADALADSQTIREACAAHSVPLRILVGSVTSSRLLEVFDDGEAAAAAAVAVAHCGRSTCTPHWLSQVLTAVPEAVALSLLRAALCDYRRGLAPADADLSLRTLPAGLTTLQPQLHPLAMRACAPCIDAVSTLCLHLPDNADPPSCPSTLIAATLPVLTTLTALRLSFPSAAKLRSVELREESDERVAAVLRAACRVPHLQALSLNMSSRLPGPTSRYKRMLPTSLADAVNLRRLTLKRVPLREKSARQLTLALAKLPHLESLDLMWCSVTAPVATVLAQCLGMLPALREIGFCGESIPGQAAAQVVAALKPGQLRRLEFEMSLTDVEGEKGEQLAAAIGAATVLQALRLDQHGAALSWGRCGSLQAVLRGLARHGARCAVLTRLELMCNRDADVAHACGQLLCHLAELRTLTVRNVDLSPHGAAAFAQGLLRKPHLTAVDMSRCKVNAAGLRPIMAAMHALPSLANVTLSGMVDTAEMAGWEAAEVFGPAMHGMHALVRLQLSNSALGADGVPTLAQSLPHLRRLSSLDLSGNGAARAGLAALAGALCSLTVLRELCLRRNKISGADGAHLERLVRGMTALTNLDLSGNSLQHDGAAALARGLCPQAEPAGVDAARGARHEGMAAQAGPRGLQQLRLVCCQLGVQGMNALAAVLRGMPRLRLLAVSEAHPREARAAFAEAMAAAPALAVSVDGNHIVA
eukprot:jgi/Ulvmu1/1746/UM117_0023.1